MNTLSQRSTNGQYMKKDSISLSSKEMQIRHQEIPSQSSPNGSGNQRITNASKDTEKKELLLTSGKGNEYSH